MHTVHPVIVIDYVASRRQDLLREAAADSLRAEARQPRPAAVGLCCRIGTALVRAGERLQGARDRRAAVDLSNAAGALDLAR